MLLEMLPALLMQIRATAVANDIAGADATANQIGRAHV